MRLRFFSTMKLKERVTLLKEKLVSLGSTLKVLYKPITDVIKTKHRFVVIDNDTLKEKFSFQLSGINLFVALGVATIALILLTTVIIAFTPLREYIPGYTNSEMVEQTYRNEQVIDSLMHELDNQSRTINVIKALLMDQEVNEAALLPHQDTIVMPNPVIYTHSRADSLLRREVETKFNFQL